MRFVSWAVIRLIAAAQPSPERSDRSRTLAEATRNRLEVFALSDAGQYAQTPGSHLLPGLDIPLLERWVGIRSWRQARQTFRAGLSQLDER
jgi:hypothetical protein